MLHTIHNYLFNQHHFHRTNPLIHMNSRLQYANTKLISHYYIIYDYTIQPNYCEGTLCNFNPIKKFFLVLATICKNQPSNPFSDRVSPVCRGRCHEVHVWQHLQPPLQGLDSGQIGQSKTISRRDTYLQPSPCVATTLQRWSLPSWPCSLSGTWSGIFGFLQESWQSDPWLRIRVQNVGHSPTILGTLSHNKDSLILKLTRNYLSFLFFLLFIFIFTLFILLVSFLLCLYWRLGSVLFFLLPARACQVCIIFNY